MHKLLILTALLLSCGVSQAGEVLIGDSEVVYQTIALESSNQPMEGQALVALTLINRARDRHTTPEIEALRPFQYSCWNEGGKWAKRWIRRFYTPEASQRARMALKRAITLSVRPEYQGIRHYHVIGVHPKWAKGAVPVFRVGSHLFYSNIK
mgnify:CR=1 FL=1